MKFKLSFYLVFIVLIAISFIVNSQSISQQENLNLDYLWLNQFDIKPQYSQNNNNSLLMNESEFQLKFNLSLNGNSDYSEEFDSNMNNYFGSGIEVWFMDNILQAMEVTSNSYIFEITNGNSISVGDNISILSTQFPNSWLNKNESGKIFVLLKNNNSDIDMNLTFHYNVNSNLITKISVQ
ncbi:hypothetical protein [Sediminibacterium sp. C3]|uniref:hypothetical protein n=1 Tax=Sediminibacterium sp. C3 TaxID=1267211 RepID=UPI00040FCD01|nr:hypothetical protein [Sediminibacterium sp. C3]